MAYLKKITVPTVFVFTKYVQARGISKIKLRNIYILNAERAATSMSASVF